MEATGQLYDKIRPPRLEDAGLEDCALPPESIKQAFLKAASAVKSIIPRLSDDDDESGEGSCVNDPWPTFGDSSDAVVGIEDGIDDVHDACDGKKVGSFTDVAGDEVVIRDAEEKVDELVVPTADVSDAGKACVDGLQGLDIGKTGDDLEVKKLKNVDNDDDDEKEGKEDERPILAEGYV